MMPFRGVDYLLIDTQFSEQELMVRQTARRFTDESILPVIRDCFREARFPRELIAEMARLGFLGASLEGYGCAGMSNVEYGLVMQEIERGDSGIRSFVSVQGAFGAWTVTMKLQPVIVTIHLLLGLTLLGMLTWVGARQKEHAPVDRSAYALRIPAAVALILLALQIALGGWVSTNYAALACTDFPLCHGVLIPQMDFANGFTLWRGLGKTADGEYLPFAALTAAGVFFVTRLKRQADYTVVERRIPPQDRGIDCDQIIRFGGPLTRKKYPGRLRRVVYRPAAGERLEFLTNHLTLGASTVARIYKDRWQIELFFKALKQNLRVKTFVGTSANALHIQIWTALIALLVLKYLQLKARFGWSLSNLVALLRMNLLVYRDLWTWLDEPFTGPPPLAEPVQGALAFS